MEAILVRPYAEFPDETVIAYSDIRDDCTVEILIERPRNWGFDSARCLMPAYRWLDVDGFSESDLDDLESFLRDNAPLIFEFASDPESGWRAA
ncbi:hypothetical protein [Collinsella ihumii]|uniref:Uncharacterized protein n=1 Tax=Collinsella ihumii TaxID=1720204 RepID=A0ABT7XC93_9ACTN|nr:hypothetical protein [Collinsella ihumii]MDN0063030.1 hypothetical protein [Collinsella ihumii]